MQNQTSFHKSSFNIPPMCSSQIPPYSVVFLKYTSICSVSIAHTGNYTTTNTTPSYQSGLIRKHVYIKGNLKYVHHSKLFDRKGEN